MCQLTFHRPKVCLTGKSFAPATANGIRGRNALFSGLSMIGPLTALLDRPATDLRPEDHEAG